MAKKNYISPTLLLVEGDDPTIVFGNSVGTSGTDSMWSFSDIDEDTLTMILANCDDTDLAAMDTDGDLTITLTEYESWYEENGWW